jgi:hypothetical protein
MRAVWKCVTVAALTTAALGCSYGDLANIPLIGRPHHTPPPLTADMLAVCESLNLDPDVIEDLYERPLYTFKPDEVDQYLRWVRATYPDLRERIVHLGRKNIGQKYDIYLLGEYPYEVYDDQPLYCLDRSDCVVFSEHTYAMALGHDWKSFFDTLQDIRYKDGEVGIVTRNHWTLAVWNDSNQWMVEDLTEQQGGGGQWSTIHQNLKRNEWFMRRFGIDPGIPDQEFEFTYIPLANLENVLDDLRPGDWVNVIRGSEAGGWAGHTGLIAIAEDGTVDFLHSSSPYVREEPIMEYARRAQARNERYRENPPRGFHPTIGFKVLRLRAEDLEAQFQVTQADLVKPVPTRPAN